MTLFFLSIYHIDPHFIRRTGPVLAFYMYIKIRKRARAREEIAVKIYLNLALEGAWDGVKRRMLILPPSTKMRNSLLS